MVGFEEISGGELAYFLLSQRTSTFILQNRPMFGFEEMSGGELAYFLLSQFTSTSLLKSDQWSVLKKEAEVSWLNWADLCERSVAVQKLHRHGASRGKVGLLCSKKL